MLLQRGGQCELDHTPRNFCLYQLPKPTLIRLPAFHYQGWNYMTVSQQLSLPRGVPLYSRRWAGFAGCQRAAEPALEHRDPFQPPGGRPMVVAVRSGWPPRRSAWREASRNQGSVRATAPPLRVRHSRPRAAPECSTMAVLGTAHQPRDHRIESDITGRRPTNAARPSPPPQSGPGADGPSNGSER
jgi:hypothetical protein